MDNFDYKKYVKHNPLLKEYIPMDSEEYDDDIIDLENDPVFEYNTEIYVPPHVRGEDVIVRADAENYRLPVEFLVDMAEQFGDMGSDATSFVEEAVSRFVEVGIAESEKDKLYNWFDNIMYAEGTMSDPEDVELGSTTYLTPEEGEDEEGYLQEGFDFKKYIKDNPLLKEGITWENRKSGERLPTLEDYKESYENKNSVKELHDPRIEDPRYGSSPGKFAELRDRLGDSILLDHIALINVNDLEDILDKLGEI